MLSKFADKILKSTEKADAYVSQKEFYKKMSNLHEAITNKHRFNIVKGYSVDGTVKDADFIKIVQSKLVLTDQEKSKLNHLFSKYGIS